MDGEKGNLFEDIFEVLDVDPDGKKFDKGAPRGLVAPER